MMRYAAIVFVAAFALLAWRQSDAGVAAAYADPVTKMRAQDEAVYADAAMRMARRGDWGTPNTMGRPFLQKPPLLFWLSAAAIKVFGVSLLAIRLPALLLGAAAVAAVFAWAASARGTGAGILGAGLLALSPFWQIFSRLCYTDVPAAALAVLALAAVALDPKMERRWTPAIFGACGGGSILAKSVAGLLPFAAFGIWWVLRGGERPRIARVGLAVAAASLVVAPWFVYQALTYPQWFWADFVQVQILGVGTQSLGASIFSRPSTFYLARMAQLDPVLLLMAALALPGAIRRGEALAAWWIAVAAGALWVFQAKSLPYLTMIMPALCVLAAVCAPRWLRDTRVATVLVIALLAVRGAAHPEFPPIAGAQAMRAYYALGRDAELMSCEPEDEFYSATLPLTRVRYCYVDPGGAIARSVPHYAPLGVVVTADEFERLPELMPVYRARLRAWNWLDDGPVGTTITLNAASQIGDMLRANPRMDFCVPAEWAQFADAAHEARQLGGGHVYLLSRDTKARPAPLPALPGRW